MQFWNLNSVLIIMLWVGTSVNQKDFRVGVKHFWKFKSKGEGYQMTKYGPNAGFKAITHILVYHAATSVNQKGLMESVHNVIKILKANVWPKQIQSIYRQRHPMCALAWNAI